MCVCVCLCKIIKNKCFKKDHYKKLQLESDPSTPVPLTKANVRNAKLNNDIHHMVQSGAKHSSSSSQFTKSNFPVVSSRRKITVPVRGRQLGARFDSVRAWICTCLWLYVMLWTCSCPYRKCFSIRMATVQFWQQSRIVEVVTVRACTPRPT